LLLYSLAIKVFRRTLFDYGGHLDIRVSSSGYIRG